MAGVTDELKSDIHFAARWLVRHTGSYYGHVAVRLPEKHRFVLQFLRPPLEAGRDFDELLTFDLSGTRLGAGRETPNEMPIYTEAFKSNPAWNAVIHVHPENAIALSVAGVPLRAIDQQSRWFFDPVPIYPSATSAETLEVGRELAQLMQKNRAVTMRGHGIVVAGETLKEAFARAWLYERTARLIVKARALGEVTYLNDEDVRLSPPAQANTAVWLWAHLQWQERQGGR
ncbi:MAG TPA: class II aldolase/adducin family protein [Verrucomicrobiae bacterium]|jgi:ribulose-5-phosphate 4-epimerase/fuculose-1-phosphate aldolase|nr:class II aldolase/adducin family protein [Verrucomicrobiae bacterium]